MYSQTLEELRGAQVNKKNMRKRLFEEIGIDIRVVLK